MFEFPAILPPANLGQPLHSPTGMRELPSPNLAGTFLLRGVGHISNTMGVDEYAQKFFSLHTMSRCQNHQPNHPEFSRLLLASSGASTLLAQCETSPDAEVTRRQSSSLRHGAPHAAEAAGP